MVVMDMVVTDMVVTDTDMVTATDMATPVMGMAATDMATVMRTGIIIIGTTAIDTVTVVIGAVVGTDMEWAPAGDGRRVATFGFATKHKFEEGRRLRSAPFLWRGAELVSLTTTATGVAVVRV